MPNAERLASHRHLLEGTQRSSFEWRARLGELFDDMLRAKVLRPVNVTELDGFEGRFDFDRGVQRYRLEVHDGSLRGWSLEDEHLLVVQQSDVVLAANPSALFEMIASRNGFTLRKSVSGQSSMVAVADRTIDSKHFILLIVLDPDWIHAFGAHQFVEDIASGAESIVLLSDLESKTFPWSLNGGLHRRASQIPGSEQNWSMPRKWFFDRALGISTETIVAAYPDKKLIVDGVAKRVFVLGRELLVGGRTFEFFIGLCHLSGASPLATDEFAKKFFGYFDHDADAVVRRVQTQAREALSKTFICEIERGVATALCLRTGRPAKHVKCGLAAGETLILGPIR